MADIQKAYDALEVLECDEAEATSSSGRHKGKGRRYSGSRSPPDSRKGGGGSKGRGRTSTDEKGLKAGDKINSGSDALGRKEGTESGLNKDAQGGVNKDGVDATQSGRSSRSASKDATNRSGKAAKAQMCRCAGIVSQAQRRCAALAAVSGGVVLLPQKKENVIPQGYLPGTPLPNTIQCRAGRVCSANK